MTYDEAVVAAFALQSTLLIVSGLAISRIFRWHAAARHTVLLTTLIAVIGLPIVVGSYWASGIPTFSWQRSLEPTDSPSFGRATEVIRPVELSLPVEPVPALTSLNAESRLPQAAVSQNRRWFSVGRVLGIVWLGGVVVLCVRYVAAQRKLATIRNHAQQISDLAFQRLCDELVRELQMRHRPAVMLSDDVRGPAAIGILRPTVLMPTHLAATLTERQKREVLVHEFAHLKRNDHLVYLLETVAAVLMWPQPCIHLLRRRLGEAREEICDNFVLRTGERVNYGRTLLEIGEALNPALVLGLQSKAWKLEDRISNLLSERRNLMTESSFVLRFAVGTVWVVSTLLVGLGTPLDAQESSAQDADVQEIAVETAREFDAGARRVIVSAPVSDVVDVEHVKHNVFVRRVEPVAEPPELSADEKKEVARLKKRYKSLVNKQRAIEDGLREIEDELSDLGVAFRQRTIHRVVTTGEKPGTSAIYSVETEGPKAKSVRARVRSIDVQRKGDDFMVITPDLSTSEATPEARDANEKRLERRLKRLEDQLEELLERKAESSARAAL